MKARNFVVKNDRNRGGRHKIATKYTRKNKHKGKRHD